ncbi:hypothetical protein BLGI_2608 [Brevibacillus laterosporus GI-9]|nr:hypothetical protein BLGI_2608 [Brevibacillus laterosporus GI-9]
MTLLFFTHHQQKKHAFKKDVPSLIMTNLCLVKPIPLAS